MFNPFSGILTRGGDLKFCMEYITEENPDELITALGMQNNYLQPDYVKFQIVPRCDTAPVTTLTRTKSGELTDYAIVAHVDQDILPSWVTCSFSDLLRYIRTAAAKQLRGLLGCRLFGPADAGRAVKVYDGITYIDSAHAIDISAYGCRVVVTNAAGVTVRASSGATVELLNVVDAVVHGARNVRAIASDIAVSNCRVVRAERSTVRVADTAIEKIAAAEGTLDIVNSSIGVVRTHSALLMRSPDSRIEQETLIDTLVIE